MIVDNVYKNCYYNGISDVDCISISFDSDEECRISGAIHYDIEKDQICGIYVANSDDGKWFSEVDIDLNDINKVIKKYRENNDEWPYDLPVVI